VKIYWLVVGLLSLISGIGVCHSLATEPWRHGGENIGPVAVICGIGALIWGYFL
jgi:hypothetical protein